MKYSGLTDIEVLEMRKKYGSNRLSEYKKQSLIELFISSLGDPIIKVLLIALGIKIILFLDNFDFFETVGIAIAILIASLVSTISEYGSEKAFEKLLKDSSTLKCRVIRNHKLTEIYATDVVKNDLIVLETGDKLVADGIIIDGYLEIDESSINGESNPKYKEKNDSIYRGTIVVNNQAIMRVTNVGEETIYGKIASELKTKAIDTPLKIRLRDLANDISKYGSFFAFIVAISYLISVLILKNNFSISLFLEDIKDFRYLTGEILYALTLAATVIVVAVPEGLPMMITLVLSSNMKKMIKEHVLVRKMNGIETAGNISLLFTDKTGTITTGNFKVSRIIDGALNEYYSYKEIKKKEKFDKLIIKSLGNNNKCIFNEKIIGGNLTDRALFTYVEFQKENIDVIKEKTFNSKDKYAYILTDEGFFIKGAFEIILDKCKYYYDGNGNRRFLINKEALKERADKSARNGSRVIACAVKEGKEFNLNDLVLVCLISIEDEIKENMENVIETLNKAGINVIMITGDNLKTAYAVGKKINLLDTEKGIITSDDLANMSDEELYDKIDQIKIVARALPNDKSRLVKIAQKKNYIVGMTGDGVNDAPALKLADVGFSMGSGAEIAKEASDIIILDNNLKSIVASVLYGRTTFKNIRKFIMFQLTINICAITLSVLCPFMGIDTPITIMQMLWINMIMDTLAGLAFASSAPKRNYLLEHPLRKEEKIINVYMKKQIVFSSIYISAILLAFLNFPVIKNFFPTNKLLMTGFFALFIFISIFNAFNIRTHRLKITSEILKDKLFLLIISFIVGVQLLIIYYGGSLFRTVSINCQQLTIIFFVGFSIIPVDLLRKYFLKLKNKNTGV